MSAHDAVETPTLLEVTGNATPEEVAALVVVLSSIGPAADAAPPPPPPAWQANHRKVRFTPPSGPGGWRSSGLPR